MKTAFAVLALTILCVPATLAGISETSPEIWVDGPNAVRPGNPSRPDVAVSPDGTRLHVWHAAGTGTEREDIFLRRFDPDGTALEDPRRINTLIADDQQSPRVAVRADGSFLVIWESTEGDARRWVRSQAFDASGNPVGQEELLSTLSSGLRGINLRADVAALRTEGNGVAYAVVWNSSNSNGDDTESRSIQGRLVGEDGSPIGMQFQVNSDPDGRQITPAVTETADGGFLAVWVEPGVSGRRFGPDGLPIGVDFPIATSEFAGKLETDAALGWRGQVLVTWHDDGEPGDGTEIRGRWLDRDLSPLGEDFRINDVVAENQEEARIADFGPLGFLVGWRSQTSPGPDDNGSIQYRIVSGPNVFLAPQEQLNLFEPNYPGRPGAHGWSGQVGVVWRNDGNDESNDAVLTSRYIDYDNVCDIFCDDFED